MSEVEREFVAIESASATRSAIGFHPCQGGYFTPAGKRPRVALIAAHYGADFSEHYLAPALAERGYGFLGWNTRFRGAESSFLLEHALVDLGAGISWLREIAGVESVVRPARRRPFSQRRAPRARTPVPPEPMNREN